MSPGWMGDLRHAFCFVHAFALSGLVVRWGLRTSASSFAIRHLEGGQSIMVVVLLGLMPVITDGVIARATVPFVLNRISRPTNRARVHAADFGRDSVVPAP
jgi:hypothetical protein